MIKEEMADRRICCVIVEGFRLCYISSVVDVLDLHIWPEVDFREIRKQTQQRNKRWTDSYCRHDLWPPHLEYKDEVFSRMFDRLFVLPDKPQPKDGVEPI